jgi:hypothetical protein
MLEWVRQDVTAYIASSAIRFATYKTGNVVMSGGNRNWVCGGAPTLSLNCWVVERNTSSTLSCLLAESSDLNALRSCYTLLTADITASLPRDWIADSAPPHSGDLPGKAYHSSTGPLSGANGEVRIARSACGATWELHFQLVSRPVDDPIGGGGFIASPR